MRGGWVMTMRNGLLAAAIAVALPVVASSESRAAGKSVPLPSYEWSFDGAFGTFDRDQLKRGHQVYQNSCAGCHAMSRLYFRNLVDIGYTPEEAEAIAGGFEVTDGPDDEGAMFQRPARLSDRFVSPFPNAQAATAANGGAYPPDLSLISKGRVGGPDYLTALLVGYQEPPTGVTVPDGLYYNAYFPGHLIAMPPPLQDGIISYTDGTEATVEQLAKDVSAFLAYAAEPSAEDRKRTGAKAILFLLILTGMLYAVKRKVWAALH